MKRRLLNRMALAGAGLMLAPIARAQGDKPLSIVVGYSAGGSADLVARVVAAELTKRLVRPVVVENVTGASGMLAVQKVLAGPTDCSLVYMGGTDTVAVPMVNARVKLNWEADLLPVGRMTTFPMILAVPAASPHNSLADLLAALRRGGNKSFNYATPGIGTMQHFYGALIARQARVEMLHVPYRGGAQIANDLVGGQVDSAVLVLSTALPFLKDGRIKALSVSDAARVPQLPQVRRLGEEEGFAGMALPLWQGLFVRKGTPAAVQGLLEKAVLDVMAHPDVQAKLGEAGFTVAPLGAKALSSFIRPQATLYREIVQSARITVE